MIESKLPRPSPEMVRNFSQRTAEHIGRVANNLKKLYQLTGREVLLHRARLHDLSKYGPVERGPYIWLTEFHRCKNEEIDFEYPPGVEEAVKSATLHHIRSNRHHPEFRGFGGDPRRMGVVDVMEMVCDWTAMAEELGENGGSARGWADKNVNKKWQFSDEQVQLIYDTIGQLESVGQR